MGEISTTCVDIAKSVFQVHGVDEAGAVVIVSASIIRHYKNGHRRRTELVSTAGARIGDQLEFC
jgi:hypothetical protein